MLTHFRRMSRKRGVQRDAASGTFHRKASGAKRERRRIGAGSKLAIAGIVVAASFALALLSASLDHVNAQTTPGAAFVTSRR